MPSQWTAGQAMHSWFSKHPGVVVEVGRRSESDRDERKHKEPCLGLGLWLPDFPTPTEVWEPDPCSYRAVRPSAPAMTHGQQERSLHAKGCQCKGALFRAWQLPLCPHLGQDERLPSGIQVPLWENQAAARRPQLLGNQPGPRSSPHSAPGSWGLRCSYMNNFSGSLRTEG